MNFIYVPYDSPIVLTTLEDKKFSDIEAMMKKVVDAANSKTAENLDDAVIQAVYQAGVTIDKEKLHQVLQADRARYEEAYRRGWKDCMNSMQAQSDEQTD